MLRIDAWNELKQLAVKCTQTNEPVDLPGFGKIFLKLDYKNPDSSIRYKMTAFEGKNDLGKKTTKKAFRMPGKKTDLKTLTTNSQPTQIHLKHQILAL